MSSAIHLSSDAAWRSLRQSDCYPCPFCRQGQVSCLYLMEAFSCDCCDRIFSINLSQQTLTLETGAGPRTLKWYWAGDHWQSERQRANGTTLVLQCLSLAFILLPTVLSGVSSYIFPPLPSQNISFPALWTGLTGFLHSMIILWLWLEYYQIPVWVILQVRLRRVNA